MHATKKGTCWLIALLLLLLPAGLIAQLRVSEKAEDPSGAFRIYDGSSMAGIFHDTSEVALVALSADFLAGDIEMVTGSRPQVKASAELMPGANRLSEADAAQKRNIILLGTMGNNPLIEKLITEGKLDARPINGNWEAYLIQTIEQPFTGVDEALVILGSDRRGLAYGVFSLSEAMGVSPWYYWADVPVKKKKTLYLDRGLNINGGPKVKYRGIFLNDEAPALTGWARKTFGGFNSEFYAKVFELILRNKGNYIWPAMWVPAMFYVDDPASATLADKFGIVMATTHHEPMMRAHAEWYSFGAGDWNYVTNKEKLQEFWRGGVERIPQGESVVTVGMRGDGDEAMTEETAVELMQTIIADQRQIISEVTGKPAEETPQAWAVYKEVQDYYDKGMRVDDDILVLFCDDNWGNLRILPKKKDLGHQGGYGIYYHFDYVGAPVSYRWLNVTQIERTWEQMDLAWEAGVEDLWLVNVGDLKPMEFPISFWFDYAWDPDAIDAKDLPGYYTEWAERQFGSEHAEEIGSLISLYTKYNARRTPEMLKPETYSITNYREADRMLAEYRTLRERSRRLYALLPEAQKPAFYQLVHSPVELCCNLNEMYVAAGKNRLYAEQGRASAKLYADTVRALFARDQELSREFHEDLLDGKWDHMMSQVKIGYTSWNNPKEEIMPEVEEIPLPGRPELGYAIEHGRGNSFPDFDPFNQQSYYLDIFNKGDGILEWSLEEKYRWVQLSKEQGSTPYDDRVIVSIDWDRVPHGNTEGKLVLRSGEQEIMLEVPLRLRQLPQAIGFVENNGVISIEAANYQRLTEGGTMSWTLVPNMGRTGDAMTAGPVTAERQQAGQGAPLLEYAFSVFEPGEFRVETLVSPTQDFKKGDGLWYAIAIDDGEAVVVNINQDEEEPDYEYARWWMQSVGDHIKTRTTTHAVEEAGIHVLKVWALDPGVVFQKFVIDTGGKRDSYLGPPESKFIQP